MFRNWGWWFAASALASVLVSGGGLLAALGAIALNLLVLGLLARRFGPEFARLQESEAHHRSLIQSLDESVVVIDAQGIVQSVNPATEQLFGHPQRDLIGRNVRVLMPEPFAGEHDGYLQRYLHTGEKRIIGIGREVTGLRRDGTEVPLQLFVSELARNGERLFAGIMHDVSIRKQAELRAAEARALAEQAAASQSRFLANMSHEIRTPMNGVLGLLDLLAQGELAPDEYGYVKMAQQSAQSLLSIIDDILDLSKIRAGRLELECTPFDLHTVAEESAVIAAGLADEKGLCLHCFIGPGVPRQVHSDPARLRQVLLNLLGNAVKFTERGEVSLVVEAESAAANAVEIRFSVSDTGIGIEPERLESLFDPFTQADATITRRYGGTGLGLAIAHQLAQMMDGSLAAESVYGKGSTFRFNVRLDPVDGAAPESPAQPLSGLRVLIVDDNLTSGRNLARYVGELGPTRCDEAASAETAADLLRYADAEGTAFDLVFLKHPVDNHEHLTATIEQLPDTDLVVTLPVNIPARTVHYPAGRSFLIRPVQRTELRAVLDTLLTRRRSGASADATETPVATGETAGARVLVVEDRPINQHVCMEMLQRLGVSAALAEDGRQAVERIRQERFDLILMDSQMPVMDGLTATRQIREWERRHGGRRTPIIALTAQAMSGDREKCLDAGMDDYVAKPFSFNEIRRVLAEWLPRRRPGSGPD